MHNIAFRYSQHINRKNKKVGHLFQGRFKAILIDESAYFTRLLRYIHLNPVRANLVKTADKYLWSSHNAYLGQDEITWLTINYGLSKFSQKIEEARLVYISYMLKLESSEELAELRGQFKDGQILGEDSFLNEIRNINNITFTQKISLKNILEATCNVLEINKKSLVLPTKSKQISYARGVLSVVAKKQKISLEEVAKLMERDSSTISSLISRFSLRYVDCIKTQDLIQKTLTEAELIASHLS